MAHAFSHKLNTLVRYLSVAVACVLPYMIVGEAHAKSEQDVKAAYLYNFIKFVDWPEDANQLAHNLCVLGEDTVNDNLLKLDKRKVKNKPLSVIRLDSYTAINNQDCHILFIGKSEAKFLDDIFAQAPDKPTLSISSIEEFTESGGIIGFIKLGNVIRFNINLQKANRSDLSIRAKLLELANKVVK